LHFLIYGFECCGVTSLMPNMGFIMHVKIF